MPTLCPPELKFLPSIKVLNDKTTPERILVWNPRPGKKMKQFYRYLWGSKRRKPKVQEVKFKMHINIPMRLSLAILARTLVSLSNAYCAPIPNLVALEPEVHANWTPAFKSLLTLWKMEPLNSCPSLLHWKKMIDFVQEKKFEIYKSFVFWSNTRVATTNQLTQWW